MMKQYEDLEGRILPNAFFCWYNFSKQLLLLVGGGCVGGVIGGSSVDAVVSVVAIAAVVAIVAVGAVGAFVAVGVVEAVSSGTVVGGDGGGDGVFFLSVVFEVKVVEIWVTKLKQEQKLIKENFINKKPSPISLIYGHRFWCVV